MINFALSLAHVRRWVYQDAPLPIRTTDELDTPRGADSTIKIHLIGKRKFQAKEHVMKIHRTIATAATMGALAVGLAISATGTANASDRHTLIVRMENMHLVDDESGPFTFGKD